MNDKQFDPLDDRFRQAADQFDPPYDPADWMAMEKLLDDKKTRRRPFYFWWVTDAFMLTLFIVFMLHVHQERTSASASVSINKTTIQEPPLKVEETGTRPLNDEENEKTDNLNKDQGPFLLTDKIRNNRTNNHKLSTSNRRHSNKRPVVVYSKPAPEFETEGSTIANRSSTPIQVDSNALTINESENKSAQQEGLVTDTATIGSHTIKSAEPSILSQKENQKSSSGELDGAAVVKEQSTVQAVENSGAIIHHDSSSVQNGKAPALLSSKKGLFSIMASYGMAKSGVKESPLGPFGSIYGAWAGYQFHQKWGVKIGYLVADKNYTGGSGIYKIPPGSYYQEITDFNAVCSISEIPLMVSYEILQGKKSNWQLSAGFVTSIMKNEEYHYHFISNSGTTGYGAKYYDTREVHWFSGFRLGTSYERMIGSRFSLSAEPFLQLPISGIGQGAVNLYSFGFQLGTSMYLGTLKKN